PLFNSSSSSVFENISQQSIYSGSLDPEITRHSHFYNSQ
ncbi:uncharacterized protein METZ01_LOCUS302177, partial [marine metagenome]